jgi:hypothetical protein
VLGKALGGAGSGGRSATAMAGAVCCRRRHTTHAVVVASASAAARFGGGSPAGDRRRQPDRLRRPVGRPDRADLGGAARRKLLAAVGLDSELAPGAVGGPPRSPARRSVAVREHGDSFCMVVDGAGADAVWAPLVEGRRATRLALVGADALARLAAAERTFV